MNHLLRAELVLVNRDLLKLLSLDIAQRNAALNKDILLTIGHLYHDGSSAPAFGKAGAVSRVFEGSVAVGAPLGNNDGT